MVFLLKKACPSKIVQNNLLLLFEVPKWTKNSGLCAFQKPRLPQNNVVFVAFAKHGAAQYRRTAFCVFQTVAYLAEMLYNFRDWNCTICCCAARKFLLEADGENTVRYQRKSAIAYIFRNFWQLAPFAVVSAILLGLFCNTNAEIGLIAGCIDGTVNSDNVLTAVLNSVSVMRFGKEWWGLLLALVVFAMTESLLIEKVYNHMRTGEMLTFPFGRSFSVMPTMFLFVFIIAAINEIARLIVCGVVAMAGALGVTAVVSIALSLEFVVKVVMLAVIGTLFYAFPITFLENYKFNLALSYSVRLAGKNRALITCVAITYPLVQVALSVVCYFVASRALLVMLFSLFYLASILLVPCIAFTLYYDNVGGERKDIGRVIF